MLIFNFQSKLKCTFYCVSFSDIFVVVCYRWFLAVLTKRIMEFFAHCCGFYLVLNTLGNYMEGVLSKNTSSRKLLSSLAAVKSESQRKPASCFDSFCKNSFNNLSTQTLIHLWKLLFSLIGNEWDSKITKRSDKIND